MRTIITLEVEHPFAKDANEMALLCSQTLQYVKVYGVSYVGYGAQTERDILNTKLRTMPGAAERRCYEGASANITYGLVLTASEIKAGKPYYYGEVEFFDANEHHDAAIHVELIPDGPYCAGCVEAGWNGMDNNIVVIMGTDSDTYDPDNGNEIRKCQECFEPVAE